MALDALYATLSDGETHAAERVEDDRVTGLVITKIVETKIPKPRGGVGYYALVSYIVPQFGKKEKSKLEKTLEKIEKRDKIEIKYTVHNVIDEKLKRAGLKKEILIPLAGTRESKNIDHMREINNSLDLISLRELKHHEY